MRCRLAVLAVLFVPAAATGSVAGPVEDSPVLTQNSPARPAPEGRVPVIIPADPATLPPVPDPGRGASVRPGGAVVPSPRLSRPREEPAAEAPSPPPRGRPPEPASDPAGPVLSLAALIGRGVRDETGASVGEVADVLLSLDTGGAETVVIALGGGGGRASVRADRIAVDPRGEIIVPRSALAPSGVRPRPRGSPR